MMQLKPYTTGELAFTDKEIEALLRVAPTREDELIVLIGISLGLRRVDMAALKTTNVNLKEGQLIYHEEKKDRERTVPISPKLVEVLRKYIAGIPKDQNLLFPMTDRTLYNRLRRMCDLAGIKRRPFHALRATCIKRAQRRGWKPEEAARLVGDTLRVIQEHYTTPSDAEMAEVAREKELL
jgi:integrase